MINPLSLGRDLKSLIHPRSRLRSFGWACLLALGLTAAIGASVAEAQPAPTNDYNRWVIADWQWRLSLPATASRPGSCIRRSQSGPVWFLTPSDTGRSLSVTCAIPAGRSIMLDAPSVECFSVGRASVRAGSAAALRRCAAREWRRHGGWLNVTVDGAALHPAGFVIATHAFAFREPRRDNLTHTPGHTKGRAAVYGSASILSPLSAGTHTLVEQLAYLHTSVGQKVVYHITVG